MRTIIVRKILNKGSIDSDDIFLKLYERLKERRKIALEQSNNGFLVYDYYESVCQGFFHPNDLLPSTSRAKNLYGKNVNLLGMWDMNKDGVQDKNADKFIKEHTITKMSLPDPIIVNSEEQPQIEAEIETEIEVKEVDGAGSSEEEPQNTQQQIFAGRSGLTTSTSPEYSQFSFPKSIERLGAGAVSLVRRLCSFFYDVTVRFGK